MNTPTTKRERTLVVALIAIGTAAVFAPVSLFLAALLLCTGAVVMLAGLL